MLYVAKCRRCGYLVHNKACPDLKADLSRHLNVSHREGYDFPLQVTMKDYKASFVITTIHDAKEAEGILSVINNRGFWVAIRSHPQLENTLFSGLGNGEFKLFLKSERN